MAREDVAAMLSEDRREWATLCAALDAHPNGPLHDPESPAWTARDVYAHLARWSAHSTADLESVLAGGAIAAIEGSDDEINARWQAEDSALTLEAERERARNAFDRRAAVIESVPAERWNDALLAIARADDAQHYRAHHSYITVT